jgi:CzcA family heavy metal efflux pump
VQRVRSSSSIGFSIVHVEFEWGTNIYTDRQIVAEKLQLAKERLPEETVSVMAPISSVMGEIMLVGMTVERTPQLVEGNDPEQVRASTSPLELRTLADWVVRQRLLSVPGVAQVSVIGGERKQFQILTSPEKLKQYDVTLTELSDAAKAANASTAGGFIERGSFEYLVRNVGRVHSAEDLANSVVTSDSGAPVYVKNVATVAEGAELKRGDGSINGKPAVVMTVQKQPNVNTVTLTREIDKALDDIEKTLPQDVKIHRDIFRQSHFIEASIHNVTEALLYGAALVAIVLFLFLMNLRTTLICLLSIPLSLILTGLVFRTFGFSINTMTLGGLAIAIGVIVDDSIVDVENIFRRLMENRHKPAPEPALRVVFKASSEVRNSIVFATFIIILAFVPLFALSGMEGRMFVPLGIAYIVSLLASLVVSLTVVPALCSFLLPSMRGGEEDSFLVRGLKRAQTATLRRMMKHPYSVMTLALTLVVVAALVSTRLGREFLPSFNEGTFTIQAVTLPGTSLAESNRIGAKIEELLLEVSEVRSTARRTGRAELDEHAEGVNSSEIDVSLWTPELVERSQSEGDSPKPQRIRRKDQVMADIRKKLDQIPGVFYDVGQPLSHRLDHLLSGLRTQVAVKIFGPDLDVLRQTAERVRQEMTSVPGIVDLYVEQQVEIPQLKIALNRDACTRYGLRMEDAAEMLETALNGHVVSQVLDQQRTFDVMVRFASDARARPETIADALIDTPSGAKVPLSQLADVSESAGPNTINRENVQRRIVVQCNTAGRDLNSVIHDVQMKVDALQRSEDWHEGYFVQYGGQFESQQQAQRQIMLLSIAVILGIGMMLFVALRSHRAALLVMADLPLAMVGGVLALFLTGTTLSVASLVGFITLLGIATRNGIMMISHYQHLMRAEGETFNEAMVLRGTRERLRPVLMTALVAALGMVPLALGAGQTGKEILQPLAVVILGGLMTSTLLDQIVTPTLFLKFGEAEAPASHIEEEEAAAAFETESSSAS